MAKPRGEGCGRGIPLLEGRESFKIYIPGDAFLCIFSDKKCFLGGTIHLKNMSKDIFIRNQLHQ